MSCKRIDRLLCPEETSIQVQVLLSARGAAGLLDGLAEHTERFATPPSPTQAQPVRKSDAVGLVAAQSEGSPCWYGPGGRLSLA